MRRRRRGPTPEREDHDRWLISYADFITLLFAFFVVMYALSSVNVGKYRVLSDSLQEAFKVIPIGDKDKQLLDPIPSGSETNPPPSKPVIVADTDAAKKHEEARQTLQKLSDDITKALGPLVNSGLAKVKLGDYGVQIDLDASTLFNAGDTELQGQAVPALKAIAKLLTFNAFPISVEGHTDNTSVHSGRFPSNWELSADRAAAVVRLFAANDIIPNRLRAIGYADQRPVADNISEVGRRANRRVGLIIESLELRQNLQANSSLEQSQNSILPGQK